MQNEQLVFKNMLKKSNYDQPRSLLAFLFQLSKVLCFQKLDQYYCYLVDQLLNQLSCTRLIITKFHSILKKRYLVILIRPHICIIFAMEIMHNLRNGDNFQNADFQVYKVIYTRCCIKVDSRIIESRQASSLKQFLKVLTLTIPNHLYIFHMVHVWLI